MTDLQSPPWHTTADTEITELRRALANALKAEDVAQFAFETAKRRADNAEAHLVAVLAAFVVDPDGDLPPGVADSIAESIRQDMEGGLAVDEIPGQARRLVTDWQEENR